MARNKPQSPELFPGLTLAELQSLLDSANQLENEGAAHLLTTAEYARARGCSTDRAREEIKTLIELGKARLGGRKPRRTMNGVTQRIPAYEFLVMA